jgi:hypothetical protein
MRKFILEKFNSWKDKIMKNEYIVKYPKEIKFVSITVSSTFMFFYLRRKYRKRIIKKLLLNPNSILLNKNYQNIFLNKKINASLLNLLNGLLIDDEFKRNMNFFIKDITIKLINDDDFKNIFYQNLYDIFQRKEMKDEITNLINSISNYEKSNKILQNYISKALESNKVKDSFTNLISDSTIKVINLPKTKNIFSEFLVDVCMNSSLKWIFLRKSFSIWRPFSKLKKHYFEKNIKH